MSISANNGWQKIKRLCCRGSFPNEFQQPGRDANLPTTPSPCRNEAVNYCLFLKFAVLRSGTSGKSLKLFSRACQCSGGAADLTSASLGSAVCCWNTPNVKNRASSLLIINQSENTHSDLPHHDSGLCCCCCCCNLHDLHSHGFQR